MLANLTEETCTGTGDTLALAGVTTGSIAFSESFADGDTVSYFLKDSGGTIKVAGFGTYVSATDDITRNDTWSWNGTAIDDNPTSNITLSGGTHTVSCAAVNDIINNFIRDTPPSGRYRMPDNLMYGTNTGTPGGEFTATAGRLVLISALFQEATWINEVAAYIATTSAGGNVRIGFYKPLPSGLPGDLIIDSGDIATDATGFISNTLTNPVLLPPGTYLIGNMADNTTVRGRGCTSTVTSDNTFGGFQGVSSDSHNESRAYYNLTYGAMPVTLGTPDGSTSNATIEMYYR